MLAAFLKWVTAAWFWNVMERAVPASKKPLKDCELTEGVDVQLAGKDANFMVGSTLIMNFLLRLPTVT